MTDAAPPRRPRRRLAALTVAAMIVAACGGSDGEESTAATDPPATTIEPTEPDAAIESVDDDVRDEADSDVAAESEPEVEPVPAPEPVVVELDAFPDLVARSIDASDPVATARDVVGLPIDVGVDDATDIVRLDARLRRVDDDGVFVLRHEVAYAAATTIADVDISLDEPSPGSVEITDLYDPVMTELGYRRTGSTGSDPGDPGGPNSVNHVYSPEFETLVVNGATATPRNVFVWNDENLLGASESSADLIPGRRIDVEFDTSDGVVAVPLLAAIADAVPVPDGAIFDEGSVDLRRRSADSFDIDRGEHYLDVSVAFTVDDATYTDLIAAYADDSTLTPGADVIGGEPSFFDDGAWEATEGSEFGVLDWRRDVLLIERYEGQVRVEEDDEGTVTITFDFTLDAIAPELVPSE